MNSLVTISGGQAVTMTSREIAELTGKEHDNVRRDIKNMAAELSLTFEEKAEASTGGRPPVVFILPAREVKILVTGYSITLRARVIDRLDELERRASSGFDPASLTRADILRLALDSEQKRLEAEAKVIELEPKAKFHDRVVAAPGALTIAEAAKTLGTGRNRLAQWLRQNRWCRRNNEPYQSSIDAGLLDVKLGEWEHPERGLQRSVTTLVTGKGLAKLQSLGAGNAFGRAAA